MIYEYNENWIGGTYYTENLISALNSLPDKSKPKLAVFTNDPADYEKLIKRIQYPFLVKKEYINKITLYKRIVNKVSRIFFSKNHFEKFQQNLDLVFPSLNEKSFSPDQLFLHWIPDFQEHFLPQFFSQQELHNRKENQLRIIKSKKPILFSSKSARQDFNSIYPHNQSTQFVVQFAVTHPSNINTSQVLSKYELPEKFFVCSNQFWKHKNQAIVLKAIKYLKDKGENIFVAFTGKEHDYRNPEYLII